jgi:hypothetical protein
MQNKILKLSFILTLLLCQQTFSLPRYALLFKDKCSSCHINPTGGGMLNEDGFTFGRNVVSMFSSSGKELLISPKLSDNISFGFDYRTQYLYSGDKKRSDFMDMSGSVYLNTALSEKFNVVTRYDFVQSIWEGYAVAKILPNESYIKAGTFVPDFGIRLDDHTAYTRGGDFGLLFSNGSIQGLLYNPFFTISGIELGVNINDILSITTSVGKSKFNSVFSSDPVFTARAEVTPQIGNIQLLLGGSFSATKTKNINLNSGVTDILPTNLLGGFAGLGIDRFSLIGEYDFASDYLGRGITSSSMMLEASYKIITGLDAVVRYDRFVPNVDATGNSYSHLVLGVELYIYNFIEIRPQFRINMHDPNEKVNSLVLQFHFWY